MIALPHISRNFRLQPGVYCHYGLLLPPGGHRFPIHDFVVHSNFVDSCFLLDHKQNSKDKVQIILKSTLKLL